MEDPQNDDEHASLNYCFGSTYINLQTTRIIPVQMDNLVKSGYNNFYLFIQFHQNMSMSITNSIGK